MSKGVVGWLESVKTVETKREKEKQRVLCIYFTLPSVFRRVVAYIISPRARGREQTRLARAEKKMQNIKRKNRNEK